MATLLDHLRDHLIAENIVRDPRTAGPLPPLWREPRNGAPAPGEGTEAAEIGPTATVAAFVSGGFPPRPYESFWRKDTVDLWLRTASAPTAFQLDASIRAALIDRRNWSMAGLPVIDCEQWRSLQRLGSDDQGYTHVVSYIFETYVS